MNVVRKHAPTLAAAAGFTTALLPIGTWYVRRMTDGSDEPLGLLALAIALGMAWSGRNTIRATVAGQRAGLVMLGLYGVTVWLGGPPLLRSIPAIAAVVLWTGLWRSAGTTMLLGLSLPVIATMQFYLGYPMRVVAAGISSATLKVLSFPVDRMGTQLLFEDATLGVDAPCSGVRMLWMSCLFGAVVSALLQLGWRAGSVLIGSAMLVAVAANSLRATLLFFPEAGLVDLPAWCHEGTGLVLYGITMALLLVVARRMQTAHPCRP